VILRRILNTKNNKNLYNFYNYKLICLSKDNPTKLNNEFIITSLDGSDACAMRINFQVSQEKDLVLLAI